MTNKDKYLKDGVSEYDFVDFVFKQGDIGWNPEKDYCYIKKLDLLYLLQQHAKPTLTEDEKVILKVLSKNHKTIERSKYNNLFIDNIPIASLFCKDLFQFIQPRRRI